jgi:hypothetical protein
MSHCFLECGGSAGSLCCPYQVVNPRMHAHLYTWGVGHATAEGERIPVKVPSYLLHAAVKSCSCLIEPAC